jgi:hypothetical protein
MLDAASLMLYLLGEQRVEASMPLGLLHPIKPKPQPIQADPVCIFQTLEGSVD